VHLVVHSIHPTGFGGQIVAGVDGVSSLSDTLSGTTCVPDTQETGNIIKMMGEPR
jgi:hypothetical protein